MNKYKVGDILYYKPGYNNTGFDPLQVIKYDENKNKYLCFIFDMDGTSDIWHLAYIKETELDYLENINEDINQYKNLIDIKNINEYRYNLYDYDNLNLTKIRNKVNNK